MQNQMNRLQQIRSLNHRVKNLNADRLVECKNAILKGYQETTIIPKIAKIDTKYNRHYSYKSIGLRKTIDIDKFNAPNYLWNLYFTQVGRIVAIGEQRYFQQVIGKFVRSNGKTISLINPNFSVLEHNISMMLDKNIIPNTIILPINIHAKFLKYYFRPPYVDYNNIGRNMFNISDTRIRVLWADKRAELRSIIILNSNHGIWSSHKDTEKITIAIGESVQYPDKAEYWVETLANYRIEDLSYFTRINLSY